MSAPIPAPLVSPDRFKAGAAVVAALCAALAIAVVALYFRSLDNPLVFDDRALMTPRVLGLYAQSMFAFDMRWFSYVTLGWTWALAGDSLPVLMLTARADGVDRIIGLEQGADDYLAKPFLPRELSARIEAVLRRRNPLPPGSPEAAAAQPLCFGDCRLDLASRQLERDGVPVPITSGEFALLASFVQHPHRPLSRERLIELARGPGSETDSRSMDVQISRLRKLIEPDPARPRFVQTVWGYGYVFVPDGQPRSL